MAIRVALVDGPSAFRSGVVRDLERTGDIRVDTFDSPESFALAPAGAKWDIAIVSLAVIPSIVSLSRLARLARYDSLIAWESNPDVALSVEAIRLGARGVIDKRTPIAGVARALREIARGQAAIPRHLSSALVDELQRVQRRSEAQERVAVLSAREREVVALLADGCSNRAIAHELQISEATAKRHVHNILDKLGAPSRVAAARIGRALAATPSPGHQAQARQTEDNGNDDEPRARRRRALATG